MKNRVAAVDITDVLHPLSKEAIAAAAKAEKGPAAPSRKAAASQVSVSMIIGLVSVAKPNGKRDIWPSADDIFGVRKLTCALIYQRLAMQSPAAPKQSGSKLPHSKKSFATEPS